MGFYKKNFDDSEVREFSKKFIKDVLKMDFKCHPNSRSIDLISENNSEFGFELEKGGWKGDFWENDYSLVSGLGFRTINIPVRKMKYWFDYVNGKWTPNKNKHIFLRTNKDFTQVIIIKPSVIKNENKRIFSKFIPKNSDELETFMSFKKEDVVTYQLLNQKWKKIK